MAADIPASIPDNPALWLYDKTGQALIGQIVKRTGLKWQDAVSQASAGSFNIISTDSLADTLASGSIIKMSCLGEIRYGVEVTEEKTALAVDGPLLRVYESQPSLFAMLNNADLYPEYGLKVRSGQDRWFGFMSETVGSGLGSDWVNCLGDPRNGGIRDYPPDFVADNPDFISVDPTAPVSTFAEYYFRNKANTFIPSASSNYEVEFDPDNFGDLYAQGELLISTDRTNFAGYRSAQTAQRFFEGGVPVQFGAYVQNDFELVGSTPLAFAMVVYSTDTSGNRTGTVFKTQAADWIVNDGTNKPGWHRGQVVYTLLAEATARGVASVARLTPTFSMTADSNGDPWSDTPDQFSLPVSTQGLADTITQLCDKADCWVDAATMEIHMYNRKGLNLSGTVTLTGLVTYETTQISARETVELGQMANGLYIETVDTAGVIAVGRIERGVALGTTNDRGTATRLAQVRLRSTAADQYTVTAETVTAGGGTRLFTDFNLGDTVTGFGHRGSGTMKARIMSITVDATGEMWRGWADTLILDRAA